MVAVPAALGGFDAAVDYPVGDRPTSIALGDFDRDGKRDLAVANFNDNDVSILEGRRNGTFKDKVDYPVGVNPSSVASGDVNRDRRRDLAVANQADDQVSILPGKADGTFLDRADYRPGTARRRSRSATLIGTEDLTSRLPMSSTTTSRSSRERPMAPSSPRSTTRSEAARSSSRCRTSTATEGAISRPQTTTAPTFRSCWGGPTAPSSRKCDYETASDAFSIAVSDFDRDGTRDLAVAGGDVSILEGRPNGTFKPKVDYPAGNDPVSVVAATSIAMASLTSRSRTRTTTTSRS